MTENRFQNITIKESDRSFLLPVFLSSSSFFFKFHQRDKQILHPLKLVIKGRGSQMTWQSRDRQLSTEFSELLPIIEYFLSKSSKSIFRSSYLNTFLLLFHFTLVMFKELANKGILWNVSITTLSSTGKLFHAKTLYFKLSILNGLFFTVNINSSPQFCPGKHWQPPRILYNHPHVSWCHVQYL